MSNTNHISDMRTIVFDDIEYKLRDVFIKNFGIRTIGTKSLENKLLKDGVYVSGAAQVIDENIFYYVEDKEINYDDKKLADCVVKGVG